MKKYWSKDVLIVLLVVTNTAMAAYLADQKFNVLRRLHQLLAHESTPPKAVVEKHGQVTSMAFADNEDELQACYDALLVRQSDVEEGTVQVHMTINSSGAVNDLKLIHSDLTDPEFQSCVLDKIKVAWVEPTPERLGVVISHRFNFKKRQIDHLSFDN